MKKVRIYESESKRAVRRKLMETILFNEETQMTVYEKGSNPDLGEMEKGEQFGVKDDEGTIRTFTANESEEIDEDEELINDAITENLKR